MKLGPGLSLLALLTLAGCGGKDAKVVITGDNPEAMRLSPVGSSTLIFMDLETIRPDALPAPIALPPQGEALGLAPATAALPGCIQTTTLGRVITYTFNNCRAANTGTLSGTVVVTITTPTAGTNVYSQLFDLTATVDANKKWHYTGLQTITVNPASSSANLVVPAASPIRAAYTDALVPANNKTCNFTAALTMNWTSASRLVVNGTYGLTRTGGVLENVTVILAPNDPLTWTSGCDYPSAGTLAFTVASAAGEATTTGIFNATCGQVTLAGATLNLGSH